MSKTDEKNEAPKNMAANQTPLVIGIGASAGGVEALQ